jgi:DNA polymerase
VSVPSRTDVLRELKLAPEWRLRPAASGAPAAASPLATPEPPAADAVADGVAREPRPRPAPAHADDAARRARIATLDWDAFATDVDACTACGLCRTRNRAVPGVGDVRAQWMLIGEAPGAEEDARGEPFVGQAGRLLDNMLTALGMNRRENVYIANVLKCRPPGNRTPEPVEVDACRPYLERQIALIRPALILALGKSSASLLLGTDASIASLRGRVHRVGDVPLVVTYHPAYLLRSLHEKAKAWEDLLLARRTLAASLSDASPPAGG